MQCKRWDLGSDGLKSQWNTVCRRTKSLTVGTLEEGVGCLAHDTLTMCEPSQRHQTEGDSHALGM